MDKYSSSIHFSFFRISQQGKENYKSSVYYEHQKIMDTESYQKHFNRYVYKSKDRKQEPNQYISLMSKSQFVTMAYQFIKLQPNGTFPLRLSRQILSGPSREGMQNIMLRKHSPLIELFSMVILRIIQSGICEHYGAINAAVDFSVNPNIRTAEQDWNQTITLDIARMFYTFLLLAHTFAMVVLCLEKFQIHKFAYSTLGYYAKKILIFGTIYHKRLKNKLPRRLNFITIAGLFLTFLCFSSLYIKSLLTPNQISFGRYLLFDMKTAESFLALAKFQTLILCLFH